VIGDDVRIGAGAKILGKITIGDFAVIGANAVVIKDVPPGAVVAGVPARELRHRAAPECRDIDLGLDHSGRSPEP
jgi:serine O-acetyltransferase